MLLFDVVCSDVLLEIGFVAVAVQGEQWQLKTVSKCAAAAAAGGVGATHRAPCAVCGRV